MTTDPQGKLTFSRGVHPPDSKHLTEDRPIEPGPAAQELAIFLSQHIGAPCQEAVKKGDVVQAGQKVGECHAFVCAPVHTPIAGKVKDIALRSHPILGRSLAVTIVAESAIQPSVPTFELPAWPLIPFSPFGGAPASTTAGTAASNMATATRNAIFFILSPFVSHKNRHTFMRPK